MDEDVRTAEYPSKIDIVTQPIVKLAAVQFVLYSFALGVAAVGWLLDVSGNRVLLVSVFGQYLADHVIRWTVEMPLWGVLCGVAGLVGVAAAWAINRTRVAGVATSIVSYALALAVDLAVARTLFVHLAAGLLIGWMLLSPLAFGWKHFHRRKA